MTGILIFQPEPKWQRLDAMIMHMNMTLWNMDMNMNMGTMMIMQPGHDHKHGHAHERDIIKTATANKKIYNMHLQFPPTTQVFIKVLQWSLEANS